MKPATYQTLACLVIAFGAYSSLGTSCLSAEAAAELPAQTLTLTSQSSVSRTFRVTSNGLATISVEFDVAAPKGTEVRIEWTADADFSSTNSGALLLTAGSSLPARRELCQGCTRVTVVASTLSSTADVSFKAFATAEAGCNPSDPIYLKFEAEE
ncbi:MAG: hypothetical protein SFV15_05105 [Polyangiaceae bacterium]|nr:hypothetical protein [Polyangiaceae bacterium]